MMEVCVTCGGGVWVQAERKVIAYRVGEGCRAVDGVVGGVV